MKNSSNHAALAFLSLFIFLACLTGQAYSCRISFDPSPVITDSNGVATLRVTVLRDHRRCDLGCNEIRIEGNGVEIVRFDPWKDDSRKAACTTSIVVRLLKQEGTLRVWRKCAKQGVSEGSVKVVRKKTR